MRSFRTSLLALTSLATFAAPLAAQEGEAAAGPVNLLSPSVGLMFWTLVIFVLLLVVLAKFAFPPIVGAVEERERALQAAIDGAKADREAAAALLAQQQRELEEARTTAQQFIADGRAAGERVRSEMMEQTQRQQQEMLERARREIEAERERAVADLRREAVDLALAGASKVIERNLDDAANRRLIDAFLATIPATSGGR